MVIHNTFSDFALFLYVHMAYADGELHDSEVEVIHKKMHKLYQGQDPSGKFDEIHTQYSSFEKDNLKTLFHDTFAHFNQVKFTQKYKVYGDMYDIIYADGKVLESETKALDELRDIIDINSDVAHGK
jgi:uncharacterized tellurite resistance protein B-like protein